MNLIREKVNVDRIAESIAKVLREEMSVEPENAFDEQFYKACAIVLRDLLGPKRKGSNAENYARGKKQVYYLSMEFLMGKSLKNNLYNLGLVEMRARPRSWQRRSGAAGGLLPGRPCHRWLYGHRLQHPVRVRHL